MSRPVTAHIVFSSKCHRCEKLHEIVERIKPELAEKVTWEDHDISQPAQQQEWAAYPLQRIPLIVVRGENLPWTTPDDLWWMGVPSEDDLRRGLGGLWVKNNAQRGGSNGTLATPSIHAVRVPAPKPKHSDYEHYAVLDQPMSESIKNLLRFNIEGLLSNLLAMEEHLAQIQRSVINDSWCIQKHRMIGRNHHLLEAINHAAEVSAALSEKFKAMLVEYDTNTEKPDIACVRKLRNWIREEVGDKTLGSGCPLCASDTAGAEKILVPVGVPANGNGHGIGWALLEQQFEKQKRFIAPPPVTPESQVVTPTADGQDLENVFRNRDAHIRLEDDEIAADVFDSEIKDPTKAHLESESAQNTPEGANDITYFLRTFGFDVVVKPGA